MLQWVAIGGLLLFTVSARADELTESVILDRSAFPEIAGTLVAGGQSRVEADLRSEPNDLAGLLEALELSGTDDDESEGGDDEGESAVAEAPKRPRARKTCRGTQCAYDTLIQEYAKRFRVEPALVKAMIRVESAFDPAAVSPKGARGLMQLMPLTARRHGASNLHDPRQNIRAGVLHLRGLLNRYRQNLDLALAAYNAGSQAVRKYGGLPPYEETRSYVIRVKAYRQKYRRQLDKEEAFQET